MGGQGWHPYFRALWEHCRTKPHAEEDHPWGETVFKVGGRVFAFLGTPERAGVTVKASHDEVDMLLGVPYIERAKYVGRYGWITARIEDDEALSLALQLVDDSYDLIDSRRRVKR